MLRSRIWPGLSITGLACLKGCLYRVAFLISPPDTGRSSNLGICPVRKKIRAAKMPPCPPHDWLAQPPLELFYESDPFIAAVFIHNVQVVNAGRQRTDRDCKRRLT